MKKRLKIAMFFSSDPSQAGGVQEHVFWLSQELKNRGHKVYIYGPEKNVLPYKNYHAISKAIMLPMPNGNWSNITVALVDNKQTSDIIEKNKFDIVHLHEPQIPFTNWELIKDLSVDKVATFHAAWDDDSIINFINPFLTLFKDTFSTYFKGAIFVSKIVKKRWVYLCHRNVEKRIIYNGVDKAFFPIKKNKKNKKTILFLGRLVSRKGIKYLLHAFKKVIKNNKNVELLFVGGGQYKETAVNYVKNNHLEKYVKFIGEVFGKKRIKYYQNADIFCAPYVDEAFGMTIIEAMACGIPIVGFKNQAFSEILKDYPGKKYLVRRKDTAKLTNALEKALKDEETNKKIFDWEIKKAKLFDWPKIASETEEMYYKILSN